MTSLLKSVKKNDKLDVLDTKSSIDSGQLLSEKYQKASPYPHIILENFLPIKMIDIDGKFPSTEEADSSYQEGTVGGILKYQYNPWNIRNEEIQKLFAQLSSPAFLGFLESMTGIDGLIPDPYFEGGGLHETKKGGRLGIHADFRINNKLKLQRRINVIIYLNKNWEREWGGGLEIWDREMKEMVEKVIPHFNTAVIFNTDDKSYHGHPDALNCPSDRSRKSIALYFYTASDNIYKEVDNNTTDYKARPGIKEDKPTLKQYLKRAKYKIVQFIVKNRRK